MDAFRAVCGYHFTNRFFNQPPVIVLKIDRKNKFSYVPQLRFTLPDMRTFHNDTIVDGELVTDIEPDGRQIVRFLAFDMLACHGVNLITKPLTSRLGVSTSKWTGLNH